MNFKNLFKATFYVLVAFSFIACSQHENSMSTEKAEASIRKVMHQQEIAWNNADIEGFMNGYWKNDSLVFVGSRGPQFGWETTLNNYKKSYPDPETMGKLTFDILNLNPIGNHHYHVIGKYTLNRTQDTLSGYYSLVWKKMNDQWLIIADHSS